MQVIGREDGCEIQGLGVYGRWRCYHVLTFFNEEFMYIYVYVRINKRERERERDIYMHRKV